MIQAEKVSAARAVQVSMQFSQRKRNCSAGYQWTDGNTAFAEPPQAEHRLEAGNCPAAPPSPPGSQQPDPLTDRPRRSLTPARGTSPVRRAGARAHSRHSAIVRADRSSGHVSPVTAACQERRNTRDQGRAPCRPSKVHHGLTALLPDCLMPGPSLRCHVYGVRKVSQLLR